MNVRGIITGLTRGSNRNHIVRAALESIAFQVNDLVDAIFQDIDINLSTLKVDGGACANNFLMQFQADIIQLTIDRPTNIESTALGAGMLAGLGTGFWSHTGELQNVRKTDRIFTAEMTDIERSALLNGWKTAVKQAKLI
jgi:glycerol kinase